MIDAARAHRRLGGPGLPGIVHRRSLPMPHPLSVLLAGATAPLLGLAIHAAPDHALGHAAARAAAALPHNLCASCHGGGSVVSSADALDARDLTAARVYLEGAVRG
jgi:hypothetical protein